MARLKWSGSLHAQREYKAALAAHPPKPKPRPKRKRKRKVKRRPPGQAWSPDIVEMEAHLDAIARCG